jgi:4-hydroxy-tetrahydrodipicolinate synthase
MEGRKAEAFALYQWFLPLLRMDTVVKFVQLIKSRSSASAWEATVCGRHDCRCKARSCAKRNVIDRALATRPRLAAAMETNVSDKAAIA